MGDTICYEPIGTIHTEFDDQTGMPIQASVADGATGTVELDEQYADGLADLDGFSHVILLYHFHESGGDAPLRVEPFLEDRSHGVFATRAPRRPNPIGLSVVSLERVDGTTLTVSDIDVVDGTPLLDVKPYVPAFDDRDDCTVGWMEGNLERDSRHEADDRFLAD
jgi:tRNA-Thr(GGU) m(6)t(6)A37 methyltransferase TsaA